MATTRLPQVARLVDLNRYPIHDLEAPASAALVKTWADELQRTGACNLQGFLTVEGARTLAAEAEALQSEAYQRSWTVNFLYQAKADPSLPREDPTDQYIEEAKKKIELEIKKEKMRREAAVEAEEGGGDDDEEFEEDLEGDDGADGEDGDDDEEEDEGDK